ncbi:hypothetical protein A6S26_29105 [Nostoc sp. ATCC 43529]|nr:hypothetical protein A6S26_29105 [Nostoc sp. ATCC 43529]
MNIFKYIKKAIVFSLVVFGLSWALQSPSFAAGLEGNWKLTTLGDSPVPAEVQITANFDPSEHGINGRVVCNQYFSGYESTEDAITLRPVISTRAYCGDDRDYQYIRAIELSKSYKVSDQELTINTNDPKANVLKFVKVQ